MQLGREIPEELYQAVVEIYLYFLEFDPSDPEKFRRKQQAEPAQGEGKER